MTERFASYPAERPRNRAISLAGYAILGVVAVRELTYRVGDPSFPVAVALLGAILLLTATDPFLFRRFSWYRYLYVVVQMGLIQALGSLAPYLDIWGGVYIFVNVQAFYYLSFPVATIWGGASAVLLIVNMAFGRGWAYGLGFGLTYVAGAVIAVSWDLFSARAETARRESQALLAELRQVHRQLQDYAVEVEAHAAIREHDRLAHELHDSVGQTIFGITLTAEAARLLLDKDPSAVPEQLERLQEMTSGALSQMRSLISQWRPQ